MSHLGLMLFWSAIQVSLVLLAAAALHALASRRSPASGAWVASLGLGLAVVVGLLSLGLQRLAPGADRVSHRAARSVMPAGQVPSGGRRARDRGYGGGRPAGADAREAPGSLGAPRKNGGRAGGILPTLGKGPGGCLPDRGRWGTVSAARRPLGRPPPPAPEPHRGRDPSLAACGRTFWPRWSAGAGSRFARLRS